MIPLYWYLVLSAALFCTGLVCVLIRRNAVVVMMGIELMLNAVNINLLAFWRYLYVGEISGQIFVAIVFTAAAAETAVGMALIYSIYRRRRTVTTDEINLMKG
jgi:NADH-quinone oxidoreductase subunit K